VNELLFTEADKQKFIEFLNIVAKCAKFEMNTQEIIEYFKLLSHMQQVMLPKLNANILEVVKVEEAKKAEPAKAKSK
jgi:hypothetical protein